MSLLLAGLLALAAACRAGESQTFQTVVVKPGDTLWSISNRYLLDPARWDQILKFNKLPSSDPTVALPGMSLRVPVRLIKQELRAAEIIYILNRVNHRRRDTAAWKNAKEADQVFEGDSVRTLERSRLKVRFLNSDLLSLDANSLAIIKPPAADYDVELKKGGVFVGNSRVITATARITPRTKDTEYSAKVRQDLSTLVEVYQGRAGVDAQGQTVEVGAGMATEVNMGMAPSVPSKIPDLPDFEDRAAFHSGALVIGESRLKVASGTRLPQSVTADDVNSARDIDDIGGDMRSLRVGTPVRGYRVQASRSRQFSEVILDKTFDADEKISLKSAVAPGVYWWRIALIDLLGSVGDFSSPRLYAIGVAAPKPREDLRDAIVLIAPQKDETVSGPDYKVKGLVKYENITVDVNDRPVRTDEAGNFISVVRLKEGRNTLLVRVTDSSGNFTTITRLLTWVPRP